MLQAVTAGSNPITLKKGIDKTCEYLVAKLKEVARPVKGTEDIKVGLGYGTLTSPLSPCDILSCCDCQSREFGEPHAI